MKVEKYSPTIKIGNKRLPNREGWEKYINQTKL